MGVLNFTEYRLITNVLVAYLVGREEVVCSITIVVVLVE